MHQPVAPDAIRVFQGTGGEAFAEQLIASGVKYVFGNSASEDAAFYEALIDRPQLQYILTPHEGPGAAMAAGYVKASGQPSIVMEAAVVGLTNALGQMFNAWKEQTPLVFYSYRTEDALASGHDGFEELPGQDQLTTPMTKLTWMARGAAQIPETIRRAFRVAWTPPYGPTYANWNSDYTSEKFTAEIIRHDQVDPRMRVRPNPVEVQRAARLLVEAQRPVLIVGDEIYKAKAFDTVIKLAELLALPVTQARSVHANFPQQHPLWVGGIPGGRVESLAYPTAADLVINIGNKLQPNSAAPIVSRKTPFIDMRNDAASIGNVLTTAAPLVADVAYGTEDLLAAVSDLLTPALRARVAARADEVRAFSTRARELRRLVSRNPLWDASPLEADRVTWEVAQWADRDAIIVHEAGSVEIAHSFEFDPRGGRELFFYYGAHLGSGVGTAAGVQLARPGKQVVCLVGDGSFLFGPTALWNMARLELPVTVVVYNNHAYNGPHNRALANLGGTGRFARREQVRARLPRQARHGHGGDRQGVRSRWRAGEGSGRPQGGAGPRAEACRGREAVSDRRRGRAPRPGLGRGPLGAQTRLTAGRCPADHRGHVAEPRQKTSGGQVAKQDMKQRRAIITGLGAVAAAGALGARSAEAQGAAPDSFTPMLHPLDDWMSAMKGNKHRIVVDTTSPMACRTPSGSPTTCWRVTRTDGASKRRTWPCSSASVTAPRRSAIPTPSGRSTGRRSTRRRRQLRRRTSTTRANRRSSRRSRSAACSSWCAAPPAAVWQAASPEQGGDVEAVLKEMGANLIPSARIVPAGVVSVVHAQERRFALISVG